MILFYYNIMSGVGISYTNERGVTFTFYLWLLCCDFVVEVNLIKNWVGVVLAWIETKLQNPFCNLFDYQLLKLFIMYSFATKLSGAVKILSKFKKKKVMASKVNQFWRMSPHWAELILQKHCLPICDHHQPRKYPQSLPARIWYHNW